MPAKRHLALGIVMGFFKTAGIAKLSTLGDMDGETAHFHDLRRMGRCGGGVDRTL
jgi:hypothetical protein